LTVITDVPKLVGLLLRLIRFTRYAFSAETGVESARGKKCGKDD